MLSRRLLLFAAGVLPLEAAPGPYPPPDRAAADLRQARERARNSGKLLMVVFGGNWCADCRALHARLHQPAVREYVEAHFEIVNVNIGEMDANLDLARSLGVSFNKGVPTAAFFTADGKPVGITRNGELEPARQYDARQVLTFLRQVAEKRVIEKPR